MLCVLQDCYLLIVERHCFLKMECAFDICRLTFKDAELMQSVDGPGVNSRRSSGKSNLKDVKVAAPSDKSPNVYLLGKTAVNSDIDFSFMTEATSCALRIVQNMVSCLRRQLSKTSQNTYYL